jgi:AcrR family transcriptional regulator
MSSAPSAPTPAPAPQRSGLRERVKARTRRELIDAALTLFAERGFDDVTVDDIAEAADISPRTFFRYFPVKEDVVLADLEDSTATLLRELAARPPEEPPLTALRAALQGPLDSLEAQPRLCGVLRVVKSCPSVQAHEMAIRARTEMEIAAILGERMGVNPAADPRPLLIATTFMAGVSTTFTAWIDDGFPPGLNERVDAMTAFLRGGFGDG